MVELKKQGKTVDLHKVNKELQSETAIRTAEAKLVTLTGRDQWFTLKCRKKEVLLAADWNIPSCYEDLPVWVDPEGERSIIRFLAKGSRLLLNRSKTESCRTHSKKPWGYRTVIGDWMTLNPRSQQLASRVGEEGELTLASLELVAEKQSARSSAIKWLAVWLGRTPPKRVWQTEHTAWVDKPGHEHSTWGDSKGWIQP